MKASIACSWIAAHAVLSASALAQNPPPRPAEFSREVVSGMRELSTVLDPGNPAMALAAIARLKDKSGPESYDLAYLNMLEGKLHLGAGRREAARVSFATALQIAEVHPQFLGNEDRRIALDALAATTPTPSASATPKVSSLPNLRISVTQTSELRFATGGGHLQLILSVTGTGLPPSAMVRRLVVTNAADNLNRPLTPLPGTSPSPALMSIRMQEAIALEARNSRPRDMRDASASLQSSSRHAERLEVVEGYVEIYNPSELNGGVIRIPDIKSRLGVQPHPALRQHGIEFGVFPGFHDELAYNFQDPSSKVAGYQLQDAAGNVIATPGSVLRIDGTKGAVLSKFGVPVPDDAQLVIYLAVPEAIEAVPFRVEDIPLP